MQILASVLAAGETPDFFGEVAALLIAGALIAYLSYRLGLMSIVGFLLTGVLIGPSGLGLIRTESVIESAAEVGVILLLFTIGIEFSLEKLARIRRLIFIGGGLQVGLVIALTTGILVLFGLDWRVGVYTGCLVALSSTAVVMKFLADRFETDTPGGQVALGILIFQDLAVVGMVLLIPMLAGEGGGALELGWALAKAAGIVALVLLLARRIMPRILEAVARTCSPDIFLLSVAAICFGTAYLTSLAGVSLSLGAFLAGLIVSESRFREYAFGEIMPLQILFSATFFISVGLLLDLSALMQNLLLVAAFVAGVLLLKVVTSGLSVLALGRSLGTAAYASLMLAQVGEFSLVLERTGQEIDLFPLAMGQTGTQTFIAATVMLMVLTPFMGQLGAALERRLRRRRPSFQPVETGAAAAAEGEPFNHLADHVIIAGYGAAGRKLARVLQEVSLPYLIITLSPDGANEAEQEGLLVLRDDYSRQRTLSLAGIDRASTLIVADDEPVMTERVVTMARLLNPDLHILARTRYCNEAPALSEAGASQLVIEEQESMAQLLTYTLTRYHFGEELVEQQVRALREAINEDGERGAVVRLNEASLQSTPCTHLAQVQEVRPKSQGCAECLKLGDEWVHLRICMTCGHVGCCDSSKNKHATAHFHATGHPIMRSFQPGEDWAWCYVDQTLI